MTKLLRLTPVLIVESVGPCLPFWVDRLGFKSENQVPGPDGKLIFASVEREGIEVMYQTGTSVLAEARYGRRPRRPLGGALHHCCRPGRGGEGCHGGAGRDAPAPDVLRQHRDLRPGARRQHRGLRADVAGHVVLVLRAGQISAATRSRTSSPPRGWSHPFARITLHTFDHSSRSTLRLILETDLPERVALV